MAVQAKQPGAQIVADLLQKWVLKTYCMLIARMTAFPAAIAPILLPVSRAAHRKNLWIFGHLDTVGAGDLSAWHHDPGRYARLAIYLWARGGGQSASCLFHVDSLPKSLQSAGIVPEIGLGLVLWPMRNVEAIMVLNISCPLFPTCFQVTIFI